MVADRPQPPLLPESQEQFEKHVLEHPAKWLEYFKNTFESFDRYEAENPGVTITYESTQGEDKY